MLKDTMRDIPEWMLEEEAEMAAASVAHLDEDAPAKRKRGRPRKEDGGESKKKPHLSIENFEGELVARGIRVSHNAITKSGSISGTDFPVGHEQEMLLTLLENRLRPLYTGADHKTLGRLLSFVSMKNRVNPVLEHLSGVEAPVDDLLEYLCTAVIKLSFEQQLERTLFRKWCWQAIALLSNDAGDFGADGMLVIKGPQGNGKTELARCLGIKCEWVELGFRLDPDNKDSRIQGTKRWIVELGELDSSMRSNVAAVKAFLTKGRDEDRKPFGEMYIEYPRRTSYIGTVNESKFLVDRTGSRRFWIIETKERFDRDALYKMDFRLFWAQMKADYEAEIARTGDPQCFRLTWQEQKQLAEQNEQYDLPEKNEQELMDVLTMSEERGYRDALMTVTEFLSQWDELRHVDAGRAGRILRKLGYHPVSNAKNKAKYMLPGKHSGGYGLTPKN